MLRISLALGAVAAAICLLIVVLSSFPSKPVETLCGLKSLHICLISQLEDKVGMVSIGEDGSYDYASVASLGEGVYFVYFDSHISINEETLALSHGVIFSNKGRTFGDAPMYRYEFSGQAKDVMLTVESILLDSLSPETLLRLSFTPM